MHELVGDAAPLLDADDFSSDLSFAMLIPLMYEL